MTVLVSFILMRIFHIASNIMSLAGIAISIGVLVDSAIVMVENASHHLTMHFGRNKVTGDVRDLVIPACRTVGRPIFFSVIIILISFIPVFALTGRDAKTFHPLAFTKSFAMMGVAVLAITLVPAMIPSFLKGRLRTEEESWLVRTLIDIYKPVLGWLMPRRNFAMWSFSALLILGTGMFPMNAVTGIDWRICFLAVVGATMAFTLAFIVGLRWQVLSFVSLAALALWAYHFPKIGTDYMPPLDEGSILDMPVTVPRVSVTQVADDLKARDALLRRFPEVESVVGKAGRAETATDPSPLDMVETVVNLRPTEYWPKRHLRYEDAEKQTAVVLDALRNAELVGPLSESDRKSVADTATMHAAARTDAALRELALQRFREFEETLGPELLREFIAELAARWQARGRLLAPVAQQDVDRLAGRLEKEFAAVLARGPGQADVNRLVQKIAEGLAAEEKVELNPELLSAHFNPVQGAYFAAKEVLGAERPTLFTQMLDFVDNRRDAHWKGRGRGLDYELFDQAVAAYDWHAIEEIRKAARDMGIESKAAHDDEAEKLKALRADLDAAWAPRLLLWRKTKDDLLKEMDSSVQVPGWANIWTQPIINRIDMLATGVRTMIGVKVFGSDLDRIQRVSEEIADVLRKVPGAVDVFPDQTVGKGYLEITVDRRRAARYGVNVGDVQDVIETALGGKPITMTVEGRERFPVRIRYARAFRQDEQDAGNLLVSAAGMSTGAMGNAGGASGMGGASAPAPFAGRRPLQVPLSMVADVKIVEGPAMIKSENGMLRSYVQLNVRDRDVIGFVEEAQRAVAQKVKMPQGMYIEWSGQFENQVHARKTMQVVFPAVLLLIFVILYITYNDLVDAGLMMMAVPEAIAGGIFFLWLFDFRFSVAVQVGFIACFGMATETGIIMLVYLREAIERHGGLERIRSLADLRRIVLEGAVHRLRPKLLTEGTTIIALAPMLWATGVGHEVIAAMAAPVLGGLLIADEVVDVFIPIRFYWVRRRRWLKMHGIDEKDAECAALPVDTPAVPR
jgi:Cu(I)/Ag(I) efflux system membrane protein CusA/SilA